MKTSKFQRRFYRDWVKSKDLRVAHIIDRETDLQIMTNKVLDKDFVRERIRQYRWDIENYIIKDRRFLTSLEPIAVELTAPLIVQRMSEAAKAADVGPMASVAAAIAEFLSKDLLKKGYRDVIIENGGDVFLSSRKGRVVRIYCGRGKLWQNLSIKITPKMMPIGICTSSGQIGHSLSFGSADSVVILSSNALLADAVATATANRVESKKDLPVALNFARSIKGISGGLIIFKNNLASFGKIELLRK